ncbi:MAG: hypothetical protein R2759_04545 [Bacteroidales bacterium]
MNGILTGSWIEEEVVFYDDTMNLGIGCLPSRWKTAFTRFLLLILMNITFYEKFKTLY